MFKINIPEDFSLGFMFIGLALMMGLGSAAAKWDGHIFPQENCWKVQEINGRIFKVNTCSGEVEEIKEANADNATKK